MSSESIFNRQAYFMCLLHLFHLLSCPLRWPSPTGSLTLRGPHPGGSRPSGRYDTRRQKHPYSTLGPAVPSRMVMLLLGPTFGPAGPRTISLQCRRVAAQQHASSGIIIAGSESPLACVCRAHIGVRLRDPGLDVSDINIPPRRKLKPKQPGGCQLHMHACTSCVQCLAHRSPDSNSCILKQQVFL
jgi:hypothetical protein